MCYKQKNLKKNALKNWMFNCSPGVPRELRGQIWLFLMHQKQKRQNSSDGDCAANTPYETLLKQLTTHQHSILIDLGNNCFLLKLYNY